MRTIKLTNSKEILYLSLREFKEKFPNHTHNWYVDLINKHGHIGGYDVCEVEIKITATKKVKYVYPSYATAARLLKLDENEIREAIANKKTLDGFTFTCTEIEK